MPRRAGVDRAAAVFDHRAGRALDHRPPGQQHHRIEIALQRGAGRTRAAASVSEVRQSTPTTRAAGPDTASDIAPSSSAVPTPKCVIGTPAPASAANTRLLCGNTYAR